MLQMVQPHKMCGRMVMKPMWRHIAEAKMVQWYCLNHVALLGCALLPVILRPSVCALVGLALHHNAQWALYSCIVWILVAVAAIGQLVSLSLLMTCTHQPHSHPSMMLCSAGAYAQLTRWQVVGTKYRRTTSNGYITKCPTNATPVD